MLIRNKSFSDFNDIRNSLEPEMWRMQSIQGEGFSDTEFEAADIVPSEGTMGGTMDAMKYERSDIYS
ncbi:hypothetical protein HHK36_029731 [Tetracentron sinense]|uniref:Uncharacterized protein n=1 Tax=Tetracentron sinense TaxID=13715 RepID=A0A834YE46_TETSI|nr:hypothetical protein HHK36_029731 [Tetracentron sinense]